MGYRDFEEGVPATVEYLKALKNANVTVLCSNMDVSNEPTMRDLFKKSMVINISGRKIGIIGYIGQDADVSWPFLVSSSYEKIIINGNQPTGSDIFLFVVLS